MTHGERRVKKSKVRYVGGPHNAKLPKATKESKQSAKFYKDHPVYASLFAPKRPWKK